MGFLRKVGHTARGVFRHPVRLVQVLPAIVGGLLGGPPGAVVGAFVGANLNRDIRTNTEVVHVGAGPLQAELGVLPPPRVDPMSCVQAADINAGDRAQAVAAVIAALPWLDGSIAGDIVDDISTDMSVVKKTYFFKVSASDATLTYVFLQAERLGPASLNFRLMGGGIKVSVTLPPLCDSPGRARGLTAGEVETVRLHLVRTARDVAASHPLLGPLAAQAPVA
jgi:hypothetical protein